MENSELNAKTMPKRKARQKKASNSYRAKVTAEIGLNVRENGSKSAKIVEVLDYEEIITIIEEKNSWGKIGNNKWINLTYVEKI